MPSNKSTTTAAQMDDYTNIAKLNSMKLIRLVRQNEALYDNDAIGYNDKWNKDMIWERIHQGLYPEYPSLSDAMKETIRANVRRRWKTLRDAIGREVRKTATVENYCRKKGNPILAELEFLIPHIKSAYCAKLTDELNLRDNQNTHSDLNKYDMDDLGESDDLHEMLDIKPFNMNATTNVGENIAGGVQMSNANTSGNADEDSLMYQAHAALYPLVQMKTSETMGDAGSAESSGEQLDSSQTRLGVEGGKARCAKRARSEDQSDFQTQVLQMLGNLERRIERSEQQQDHADQRDEDRMFLLSLVGDLKSIPAAKKMLVKAEIATAIARAGQS